MMTEREKAAHQAGLYFGRGGHVGLFWICVRREMVPSEHAAFVRGTAAGKASR